MTDINNFKSNYVIAAKTTKTFVFSLIFTLFLIGLFSLCISAQESNLVEQYSPILYFEQEEQCFPVVVDYHVDRASLFRFTGDEPIAIQSDISVQQLSNYSTEQDSSLYLDNILGTINDDDIIKDYQNQINKLGYTIYYHTIQESNDLTIVQYWFFYAFNNGDLNQHEGDWELVQIVFQQEIPISLMYSQHHSGQKANWDQVDKTGTHPHVYVARGSHANYFTSYQGTLGGASDHVGSNGFLLRPEQYTLINLDTQDWISYRGRWGEANSQEDEFLGRSGPNGPMFREDGMMWNQAITWGNSLPALNGTLLLFEWFIYHFVTIFLVILLISLGVFIYRRMKQYKTQGFGPRYFSFLYIDGFDTKSIGNILFIVGIIIACFSLFYPWYEISLASTSTAYSTEGIIDILSIDGLNGISLTLPGSTGPVPLGSAMIPFSILIGIGIVLTLVKTFGVKESKILGKSYLYQGIRLLVPVIAIFITLIIISMLISSIIPAEIQGTPISNIFDDIAGSPFGGSTIKSLDTTGGNIHVNWGVQSGGMLLLLSGIILIISGYLERKAGKTFF